MSSFFPLWFARPARLYLLWLAVTRRPHGRHGGDSQLVCPSVQVENYLKCFISLKRSLIILMLCRAGCAPTGRAHAWSPGWWIEAKPGARRLSSLLGGSDDETSDVAENRRRSLSHLRSCIMPPTWPNTEPFSSSGGLRNAVVLKDGDGFDEGSASKLGIANRRGLPEALADTGRAARKMAMEAFSVFTLAVYGYAFDRTRKARPAASGPSLVFRIRAGSRDPMLFSVVQRSQRWRCWQFPSGLGVLSTSNAQEGTCLICGLVRFP